MGRSFASITASLFEHSVPPDHCFGKLWAATDMAKAVSTCKLSKLLRRILRAVVASDYI